jgi:hypothetical protein
VTLSRCPVRATGRTIVDVLFRAAAEPIDRSLNPMYGRFGLAALTGFVAVGLATHSAGGMALAIGGTALAVAAAVPLFLRRPLRFTTQAGPRGVPG